MKDIELKANCPQSRYHFGYCGIFYTQYLPNQE